MSSPTMTRTFGFGAATTACGATSTHNAALRYAVLMPRALTTVCRGAYDTRMNPLGELPVLDSARCTGCGDCVAVCPTECLAMAGPQPWMPRPRECVSCS